MSKTLYIDLQFDPSKNPQQMKAHAAKETYILYGGAVGGGKSAWLAAECIRMSYSVPNNVGYLCRHELSSLKKTTLVELDKFLPRQIVAKHHGGDHYYKLKNGSVIYYGGLGDDKEGISRITSLNLGWFGIDQAEETSEEHFLWLASRLRLNVPGVDYHGFLTANPFPGWVRNRFIENSYPGHVFIPAKICDNPYLPKDYESRLRAIYPEELARRLIDGDWDIDAGSNYLFPYSWIRAATTRGLESADLEVAGVDISQFASVRAATKSIDSTGPKVAGVDISRYGEDETVYILRQGDKVIKIDSWQHQDTQFSAGRIARNMREDGVLVAYIDSIGVGAGVFDPLRAEGFNVKEVNVGEQALDKERYTNKRAEYYNLLSKRFQEGKIQIPDHPKLTSQLASIRYNYAKTRLQIESKEQARKRGDKSPDYADALMLSFIDTETSNSGIIPVSHFG